MDVEFDTTVLGSTIETAAVLSSWHCRAKFIWVRYASSTTFEQALKDYTQRNEETLSGPFSGAK